jgi:predicted transcriptional regulator
MSDAESPDEPPRFEDPFRGDEVEQRVYGTVLQTRDPATVASIADRSECDPKTARKYLNWFADLGIVTRHEGHPTTYERNDSYFEWRRINRLAADHSIEDLQERVSELTERIADYEAKYDVETPAEVDAITVAATSDERTIDDVYDDLGDWMTVETERRRYERARRQRVSAERERVSG